MAFFLINIIALSASLESGKKKEILVAMRSKNKGCCKIF
jgi:hypothetical protein